MDHFGDVIAGYLVVVCELLDRAFFVSDGEIDEDTKRVICEGGELHIRTM